MGHISPSNPTILPDGGIRNLVFFKNKIKELRKQIHGVKCLN